MAAGSGADFQPVIGWLGIMASVIIEAHARAEHELFDSMRSLFRDRTVLLISHRFSSVRSADRITS